MSTDKAQKHTLNLTRSVRVYQPAVPMRVVTVIVDDDGVFNHEEQVMGCTVKVVDDYTWTGWGGPPKLKSPSPRDLADAGYEFGERREEHSVLIWVPDYNCALEFNDPLIKSDQTVAAPATMGEEWWKDQLAKKAEEQKEWWESRKAKPTK